MKCEYPHQHGVSDELIFSFNGQKFGRKPILKNIEFLFDDAASVKPCHHERRIKFSAKVEEFFTWAEKRNIPIGPLVNMLVENSIPLFTNRGYTYDGIENVMKNENKF